MARIFKSGSLAIIATLALGALGCGSTDAGSSDGETASTTAVELTAKERLDQECDGKSRHVMVIGVDGLLPAGLAAAATPSIDELTDRGASTMSAFAGGVEGTPTLQPTLSGPGWSSILTGVWTDKHEVVNNTLDPQNYAEYPHFFSRVREVQPDSRLVSAVHWIPINMILADSGDVGAVGDDQVVTDTVVEELSTNDPTVVFAHLDDVDLAGHGFTYSADVPEYTSAIEVVDAQVGEMTTALDARETRDQECWATVVVTDHGGLNNLHGGQTPEEREIPLIVAGDGVGEADVEAGPGHTAVPPTVMAYLDLPVDPQWGWESEPFGVPVS